MLTLGVATDEKEDWDKPALEKLRDGWMVGSNNCDDFIVGDIDTDFEILISVELTLETCTVVVGIDVGNVWHRSLTGQRQRYPSGFTTQRWEHPLLPLVQEWFPERNDILSNVWVFNIMKIPPTRFCCLLFYFLISSEAPLNALFCLYVLWSCYFVMLVNRMSNIVSRNINVNAKGLAHRKKFIKGQKRSNIQYQLLENLL